MASASLTPQTSHHNVDVFESFGINSTHQSYFKSDSHFSTLICLEGKAWNVLFEISGRCQTALLCENGGGSGKRHYFSGLAIFPATCQLVGSKFEDEQICGWGKLFEVFLWVGQFFSVVFWDWEALRNVHDLAQNGFDVSCGGRKAASRVYTTYALIYLICMYI